MDTQSTDRAVFSEALQPEPRHLSAGVALQWWRSAWDGFKSDIAPWVLITIVMLVLGWVSSAFSLSGIVVSVIVQILSFIMYAGLLVGAHDSYHGGAMKVAYLIEGFSRRPGAIAGLSLLCVVIGVAVMFFAGTMGVLAIAGGSMMIIPVVLACIAISAAMMMAFWFSPVLLVLHPEVDVVRAIKMSLAGCLDNILPMMVYGLLFILFAVLASIPLGLGWLVLIPMSVMSTYVAYRDIFLVNPEPEAVASSTGGDDEPLV